MSKALRMTLVQYIGVLLILGIGIIHVIDAPESFQDAAYKGWLFYANGIGALISAFGILRAKRWGWILGFVIAAGSFAAYVLSRTVGLPDLPAEPDAWFEPLGVASLLAEGSFIIAYLLQNSRKSAE